MFSFAFLAALKSPVNSKKDEKTGQQVPYGWSDLWSPIKLAYRLTTILVSPARSECRTIQGHGWSTRISSKEKLRCKKCKTSLK